MQFSISNFSKSGSKSQPKSQPVGQIHSLDFYPFKGCRPIKLQQAILTNLGIQDPVSGILDRSFMIYRPDTNKMVSTKFLNKLAVLTCEIIPHPENPKLYGLKIFFDEYENQPASTPLDIFPPEFLDPFIISNINICGKPGEAIDCGDEASQYVTSWINKRDKNQNLVEHRVVFFDPRICVRNTQNVLRKKHQKIGQNLPDNLNFKTTLSDVASYSVSTIDSFNHVNNQILKTSDTPLHPNIFRSNITIQAFSSDQNTNLYSEQPKFSSPFAEDTWQSLWFTDCQNQNKFKLNYLQKTTRCVVTTVDPKTGKTRADKQPLTWLKQNRLVPLEEVPAYGGGYKGHFGNYFSLDPNSRETQFVIKLGDSVFAELK